jgi:hypothetical protein
MQNQKQEITDGAKNDFASKQWKEEWGRETGNYRK